MDVFSWGPVLGSGGTDTMLYLIWGVWEHQVSKIEEHGTYEIFADIKVELTLGMVGPMADARPQGSCMCGRIVGVRPGTCDGAPGGRILRTAVGYRVGS